MKVRKMATVACITWHVSLHVGGLRQ
ncbi:Protein of unknown function [Lactobacillus delbrueckii subsp. lactis]|nr:Putative uncharacterized protein [Lactobacillus delbrueckii subsp. lactis]CDR80299.1 Protein of unknown function [Lactobacillus delbrueckii subsp. lactis]CDR82554.1 Protein of unknown function [Lactobacillus delbrueckii subsp. lactis]